MDSVWVLARESELKMEEVKRRLEEHAMKLQQKSTATTKTAKGSLSHLIRAFVSYLRVRNYPI